MKTGGMKIAIIIERFDPGAGGAERSTAQIVDELTARGHDITILAGAADEAEPNYQVRCLGGGGKLNWRGLRRFAAAARREVESNKWDVTLSMTTAAPGHVIQPRSGATAETFERNIAMRRTARSRRWKRMLLKLSPKRQALLNLERSTLRAPAVKCIAAVSGYVRNQFVRHYGVDEERIVVIPNASAMPSWSADERAQRREAVRGAFGVPDDLPAFAFLALNPKLKGLTPLLHAAAELRGQGVAFALMLAGAMGHGYHQRIVHLGLRDHVRIVGRISQSAPLFNAADVTVHPTYYDPSSKVVIESLMMGRPAISSAYNGASEMLATDPPRGIVVDEPDDVAGLAAAMATLADRDRRQAYADATAGLADELSMRRHVDRLEQLLIDTATNL